MTCDLCSARIRFLATLAVTMLLLGCAGTDSGGFDTKPIDTGAGIGYDTTVRGGPDDEITELLEQSLKLFTLADRKPASLARLRRRAEADMATARTVLRSEGYYASSERFEIVRREPPATPPEAPAVSADEPREGSQGTPPAPPPFEVVITLTPGERFSLAEMQIAPAVTAQGLQVADPQSLGAVPGQPARAATVVEAETRALAWLAERGYPYARFDGRTATINLEQHTLTVVSRLVPGPRIRFGELRFDGLNRVEPEYLASYTPWQQGAYFSQTRADRLQTALFATRLFDSVSVEPPPQDEVVTVDDAEVPITVRAVEAKRRSVGAGARFNTDEGPEVGAFLEHRNLFGANETGRVTALAGAQRQELTLSFRKPQFLGQPQVLLASAQALHDDNDAFEERTLRLASSLERRIGERLTVSGGLSFEFSEIDDDLDGDFDAARLIGLPLVARYDASNSLLDPTRGYRVSASLTPYTGSYRDDALLFGVANVRASSYLALDDDARYVLALRGSAGSLLGAERDDVPSTKRLYSGGGGSVRGYKARFIGPLDDRGDPIGGRSVLEGGIELRARVGENFGLVPFLEAGTVSESVFPDFEDDVQLAAGLGVRYYTVIGPIRADLAVPVNRRDEDDAFQFYISIGQAF